ncbi:hypothetical protein GALMADRAFT_206109 [Galerina marginata CBS 339.88]|uniref:F-box domain-containing protein n=1 Tax=Galerina marginata (strain CBS 339.88) TaxID=685588 RepID=A0A067TX54_GALM3|nr:hypothetical protein GALMADRAFT_206109 [Galerina marginata CBS 339.88]
MPEVDDVSWLLASNDRPSELATSIVQSIVTQIDKEIQNTHSFGYSRSKDAANKKKREFKHSYLAVLSRTRLVSYKIWAHIFAYNAKDKRELFNYALVCRRWNISVHSFPTLWTDISIDFFEGNHQLMARHGAHIVKSFTLSRALPLDVKISYNCDASYFIGLSASGSLPEQCRWRSVETGPSLIHLLMKRCSGYYWKVLEEIIIRSQKDVEEAGIDGLSLLGAAKLARLTITVDDRVFRSCLKVAWSRLVELNLDADNSTASDYLEIVEACINLKICSLRLHGNSYSTTFPIRRVRLTKLQRFSLAGKYNPVPFLSLLEFPSLQCLKVAWEKGSKQEEKPGHGIADFVTNSRCKLLFFELQAKDLYFDDLEISLRVMPLLEDLTLCISNPLSMPIFGDSFGTGDTLPITFPFLKTFSIHAAHLILPMHWFLELVRPREVILYDPEYVEWYNDSIGLVGFIYERGYLMVVSGYTDMTRSLIQTHIRAVRPDIKVILA